MARIIDLSIRDSNSPQMESIDEIQSDKRSSRSSVFKSHFAKYLPYSVVERFLEGKTLQEAEIKNFGAAVAFIDLSGFTKLSESLMTEHGPDGAEMLNRYVSSYFDILTTGIFQNGGDIIKFAGDAIQVVWKTKSQRLPDEIKNSGDSSLEGKKKNLANFFIGDQAEEEALHVHVLRAVHCTLELIRTLNNHNVGAEISLKLHAGIGCGKLKGIFVGGVENSWEYFIAGSPIKEMSDAADEAKIGELVLSKHAFECIENWVLESKVLSSGNARVMKIGDVPSIFQTTYPRITRIMEQSLLCFVPEIMRQRFLKQELLDLPGEYRKAFIMFVKLEDIDFEKPGALERLQESVCIVQQLVFLYEGFIARLIADDKGTRFKIVFGMPSQVHEDDSARVIITALEIEKRLKLAKMRCYIGIANGTVFCGEAGGSSRSEYTAVGFKVNIAARIMSIAQKTGLGLLCDEKTQVAGQQQSISFKPIPEKFTLKGVSEPVTLYRPIGKTKHFDMISHLHVIDSQADSKVNNVDTDASATPITTISNPLRKFSFQIRPTVIIEQKQGIVGRNIESLQIKQFLKGELSVEEQDVPIKAIILEGDVGIGKTQLILEAIEQAGKLGIEVFCAHGISLEKATPYRLWKSVFRQMFNLPSLSKQSIEKMLGDLISGGDKIKLPILNSMFDTQFPETNFSRSLTPDGRAEYMRQLFRTIIEKVTESNDKKILIVLEDMQWADLASWELAEEFIRCAKNSIIIIATRPLMKPIPPGYTNILKQEKITQKINLGPLSEDDGVRLACRILDVTTNALPQKVQEIIKQKAQGLPLYIKELVKSLLDQGFIQKNEDKTITVSDRLFRDDFNSFSDSIQQVITCRIDNLSANEQMTIKVCSVLGREVPLDLLLAVHPSISDRNKLKELVTSLIEAGFFCEESNEESSPGEKMEELFYFTVS